MPGNHILPHRGLNRLLVIPVVEAAEWPTHGACDEQKRPLRIQWLHRLGPQPRQIEVSWVAIFIQRGGSQGTPSLEANLNG